MKSIILFSILSFTISAQTVEIQGKAIITDVENATEDAQVLARETDGTISVVSNSSAPIVAVGDFFQGGIVFWISTDGKHGKVVALSSIPEIPWSNVTTSLAGLSSQKNGSGNSIKITKQSGHSISAASVSMEYEYAGYTDWYLPSYDEGVLIAAKWNDINNAISSYLGEQFGNFWLSNDGFPFSSWAYYLTTGSITSTTKATLISVRPIRAFNNSH